MQYLMWSDKEVMFLIANGKHAMQIVSYITFLSITVTSLNNTVEKQLM